MRRDYLVVGRSLVLAMLIVSSLVVPFAGTASAATIYNDTVTGAPKYIVVDGADVSGDFTIEMTVSGDQIDGRNSDQIILRETVGDGAVIQNFAFLNSGVYDSVDVEVTVPDTSSGSPTIGNGEGLLNFQMIGSAGGDSNLDCSLAESINNFAVTYGAGIVDCGPLPTQGINTTELTSEETQISIYQSAAQADASREASHDTWTNNRDALENDAIIAGKNAYIRELVNGTSESIARSRARDAVKDYWAQQQITLINEWNRTAITYDFLKNKAISDSGTADNFVDGPDLSGFSYSGMSTASLSLTNGSTHASERIQYSYSADEHVWWQANEAYYSLSGSHEHNGYSQQLFVREAPYETGQIQMAHQERVHGRWDEIEASSTQTVDEVDTFANNTYESYQDGDINTSDLIDPYMARAELGPDNASDYQTWALTSISALDSSTPDTLENTGSMTVVDRGTDSQNKSLWTNTTYSGIILSQSLPVNDTFEAGVTYNATQMAGGQYIVTDNKTVELTGLFTPETFTTVDGTEQQSVVYKNITYQTTTMQEYKDLMANLTQAQQDIDDRWDLLNAPADTTSGGGGAVLNDGFLSGLFDSLGFAGIPGEAVALGGGAAAAYGLTIRGGSGGFGGSRRRR